MDTPVKKFQRCIFAVSDATGRTCQTVVKAALTQFAATEIVMETVANVRRLDQIYEIMEKAAKVNGIIIYTMVAPEFRQKISELGRLNGVPTVDILGPVLTRLSDLLEISPFAKPGLFNQLDRDYFNRIEAVDYTIKHDDGRGLSTLNLAEIVLMGVSRTTKTPVSFYLSYRGWKVANIPVLLGQKLSPEVLACDQKKIVGLNIDPKRLETLRRQRQFKLSAHEHSDYADLASIRHEIIYAMRLFEAQGWPVLDVTYKSIEEVATEAMRIIYSQFGKKKGEVY